ncbi:MAG TPA: hypothetical protein VJ842_00120 [Pyrinomonadaceae bacterium]|nr:hypothetical protein [Pyrinomonadaceae bacterium]
MRTSLHVWPDELRPQANTSEENESHNPAHVKASGCVTIVGRFRC